LITLAVVNIPVELKVQIAAQDESDTGQEGAVPFGPGSTPFDQFLHRLLEQPFRFRHSAEKVQTLGSRFHHRSRWLHCHQQPCRGNADKVAAIFEANCNRKPPTGTLAAKAGLKSRGVITAVGDRELETARHHPRLVAFTPVESRVDLTSSQRHGNRRSRRPSAR